MIIIQRDIKLTIAIWINKNKKKKYGKVLSIQINSVSLHQEK
jgi:hypothetical protein